jgi:UDP-N-acetylglucosamine acyltransferase
MPFTQNSQYQKIGSSYIHPTAVIYPNVTIGENCYIGAYCIIGAPAEWKGREQEGKGVIIGNNVRITGHVTIDSGVEKETWIADNCYIMKGVHIGHDAAIGEAVTLSCHCLIGGHSVVQNRCNIGLGAIIHQKVTVPIYCMIGMGTVITKKTEMQSYSKYVGNPARYLSPNIKP